MRKRIVKRTKICYIGNSAIPKIIQIFFDGMIVWGKNDGYIHRNNNKPSCIYPDGSIDWYENDKFIKSFM